MSKFTVSDRLNGVGEYYFSKKNREIDQLRAEGHDVINFGIGSPDCPPHPIVVAKLAEEAAKPTTHTYQSYAGAPILRKAFAEWYKKYYNVELDGLNEILPLIGSKEGLMHICMTYVNKGDKVLIPNPGYPTYRSAVTLSGGEVVEYHLNDENGWLPDFDAIDPTGVKLMIMNYPNMPTGTKATIELFERAVKFAADNGILLVHDNPYSFIRNDQPIYENPSPGNKAGGISTLEEKSLGCTQKSGSSIVEDVLEYGERVTKNGLNLLSAPGNDLVASTALAAAGCHVVLFTTGRGTPFGTFVPTVKVSTNTALYNQKRSWIDFNAGSLVEGESMESLSRRFIDYIIEVASGRLALNEEKGYREIAIFKHGVTL